MADHALFMYENAGKERLALQVRKQRGLPAPTPKRDSRYAVENGVGVFLLDRPMRAATRSLAGSSIARRLLRIAHAMSGQLAAAEATEAAAPK